ncbi:MAG TPA: HD domain-containing phosphohydrolase [Gemmatimonadaceae bacterium]|jgi:putative nucleotidyltransferase with HDIG domain
MSQLNLSSSNPSPHPDSNAVAASPTADELIESGLSSERAGNRCAARELYERAIRSLDVTDSARAAMLLRWIARTYVQDSDLDAALDYALGAITVSEICHDEAGQGHATNLQGSIQWKLGKLDDAERLFLGAREKGLMAGEHGLAGMASQNLGTIASIRGDLAEALHHANVALEHYRVVNRPVEISSTLNNTGLLYTDLRRWSEAARAFDEAASISETLGDIHSRLCIEVNRAELALARGDRVEATRLASNAHLMSTEHGDTAWLAHIHRLHGILKRDDDVFVEAERHFAEAARLAEQRQDSLLLARTLRDSAQLFRRQNRNRETLHALNKAHRLFAELRAKLELANVDSSVTRLEEDFLEVVKRWGESIEAKDRYTQGHCVRVADLSCAIAAVSGIEGQALFWFRIGALLHDVGKLAVPSEVLNKPGKLTAEEWELMRSHPMAGVDLLAGVDFPWDVRPIIESHHERWDGKGYPHGLAAEAIPVSARILAIADVYDALTSERSYKRALTHDDAMEIMRRDVGTAFDPVMFARFEAVVAKAAAVGIFSALRSGAERKHADVASPVEPARTVETATMPTRESLHRILTLALADRAATGSPVSLVMVHLHSPAKGGAGSQASVQIMLRQIVRKLQGLVRSTDFVARSGESQFMIALAGVSLKDAEVFAHRIDASLSRTIERHKVSPRRLSIHAVSADKTVTTADALLDALEMKIAEPGETAGRYTA